MLVALVSDIGKFNDRPSTSPSSRASTARRVSSGSRRSRCSRTRPRDYVPNFTQAVRRKAGLSIAAGFLLADTLETVAARFPDSKFAITDYCAKGAPTCITGSVLKKNHPNVDGARLTRRTSRAASSATSRRRWRKKQGGKQVIGAVGGLKSRPSTSGSPATSTAPKAVTRRRRCSTGYSSDFVASDKCKTVAENQIAQGAQVLFQVAGGCGLGTLKAADAGRHLGHRRRHGPVQRREARPHERRQARRHRRLRRDQAGTSTASSRAAPTCCST